MLEGTKVRINITRTEDWAATAINAMNGLVGVVEMASLDAFTRAPVSLVRFLTPIQRFSFPRKVPEENIQTHWHFHDDELEVLEQEVHETTSEVI